MTVTFEEKYLLELYMEGKTSDKKHRFQPDIISRYRRRVDTLISAPSPETLYTINSLNFESLVGDKSGRYSIRVNNQYRLEFTLERNPQMTHITICNIVELSNHYK